jgi:hypothetical protein
MASLSSRLDDGLARPLAAAAPFRVTATGGLAGRIAKLLIVSTSSSKLTLLESPVFLAVAIFSDSDEEEDESSASLFKVVRK